MSCRPSGRGVEPPNTSDTAAERERGGQRTRERETYKIRVTAAEYMTVEVSVCEREGEKEPDWCRLLPMINSND